MKIHKRSENLKNVINYKYEEFNKSFLSKNISGVFKLMVKCINMSYKYLKQISAYVPIWSLTDKVRHELKH